MHQVIWKVLIKMLVLDFGLGFCLGHKNCSWKEPEVHDYLPLVGSELMVVYTLYC
jgi:hypothetical protein